MHARNDVAIRMGFKNTIAIRERAVARRQIDQGFRVAIVGFNRLDVFTHLDAIGANILNRRRTHRTWNQCEVF